jgi:membrane protease YdiL (CAAX protease family)
MRLLPRNAWAALPLAAVGFFVVSGIVKASLRRLDLTNGPAWRPQAILEMVVLVLSLTVAAVEGIGLRQLGFCRPGQDVWGTTLAGGLLLGVFATLVILVSGIRGLRSTLGGYSFGAIVIWVWVVSSVIEEVLCRGWFQTSTETAAHSGLWALLPSALLFGSLHLSLVLAGVDIASVIVVVTTTAILGLLAAWARSTSGSLYPAIAAHVAFNIGGALGGIVYAIVHRIATGRLPSFPRYG